MLNLDSLKRIDGVFYLSSKPSAGLDENVYLQVRKKEGRFYPDSIVRSLPVIDKNHPLKKEWKLREISCNKLLKYISTKAVENILEVGCGNGWLSSKISKKCGCFVAGVDVNREELKQAARVFGGNDKVKFI